MRQNSCMSPEPSRRTGEVGGVRVLVEVALVSLLARVDDGLALREAQRALVGPLGKRLFGV